VAEPAQIRGKNLTQIHAARKAARCLLTHRFKTTKICCLYWPFRVLKEKEVSELGESRTYHLVLEAWDRMETNGGCKAAET